MLYTVSVQKAKGAIIGDSCQLNNQDSPCFSGSRTQQKGSHVATWALCMVLLVSLQKESSIQDEAGKKNECLQTICQDFKVVPCSFIGT